MNSTTATQPGRFSVLLKYLRGYKGYLIFGGIAVILANSLNLITPYVLKLIFDKLEQGTTTGVILQLVFLMIGLSIVAGIFRFFMRRTIIWMSRKLEYDLRGELFSHLMKLSPSFYDQNRTGDIMARATSDIEAVRMMIGPGIMQIANTIVTIVVALSFMIYLSPKLTLYAMIPMAVVPFAVHRLGSLVHKRYTRAQEQFSLLTATAQENLAGIRIVKAYQQEEEEIKHFSGVSNDYVRFNLDMARIYGILFPLVGFIAAVLNLTVLYFGGMDVMANRIPLGTMVAFFGYLTMLFWPMMAGGWVISLYQQGTASLDRINKLLFTEPEVKNEQETLHTGLMEGVIEFRHLSFGYFPDKPVIKDFTLTLKSGQTLGIVGPVGSGKTTLVSLLTRLYQVSRGQIFVDGIDILDWDLNALRSQIGFATQEPFLFSDSIAENIRFGRPDADSTIIQTASDTAALAKDVETFPAGIETMIGERGITLSGGQKQRTAIARALAIEPSIVILDDATSAVDTETEDQINRKIHAAVKNITTIIISHRISSVKDADIIVYLEAGQIAEQGTHEALIARKGAYDALYRAQLLAQEIEQL